MVGLRYAFVLLAGLYGSLAFFSPSGNLFTDLRMFADRGAHFFSMSAEAQDAPDIEGIVKARLQDNLDDDLYQGFDLFLYVNKGARRPYGQRLFVYAKRNGGLELLYNWPVSTGRETQEINRHGKPSSTVTPRGYYQLDPHRFYARYRSGEWGSRMPYTMFLNWISKGYQTGLAVHGAGEEADLELLGQRASAGCVRMDPKNAQLLYRLIRREYRGQVPRFAYDRKTLTMSNTGELMRDKNGRLVTETGFRVLVFVDDFSGPMVVSALF